MPAIYPVPITSAQGVGNATAASNNRVATTFAISGLALDVAKGTKIDALLKTFTAAQGGGAAAKLFFPGNPPIDIDAKTAQMLVPKLSEPMSISFTMLRQSATGAVELLFNKATPLNKTNTNSTDSTHLNSKISSAARALQMSLFALDNPIKSQPIEIAEQQFGNSLENSASTSTKKNSNDILKDPISNQNLNTNSTKNAHNPGLVKMNFSAGFAAPHFTPINENSLINQTHNNVAQTFSTFLSQITHQLGIGYERSVAMWSEHGAQSQQVADLKSTFPQAQPANQYNSVDLLGNIVPSALSIGQQVLANEQQGFAWQGNLTSKIAAQISINLQRPPDFPPEFKESSNANSNEEDKHNSPKFPSYLRMHLSTPSLGDIYIWGISIAGTNHLWMRCATPNSNEILKQHLNSFNESLVEHKILLNIVSNHDN